MTRTDSTLANQSSISPLTNSANHLFRVSSADRLGTGQSVHSSKVFTRHNVSFNPVETKPPIPSRNLTSKRGSSGETKRPRPKLEIAQRSNVSRQYTDWEMGFELRGNCARVTDERQFRTVVSELWVLLKLSSRGWFLQSTTAAVNPKGFSSCFPGKKLENGSARKCILKVICQGKFGSRESSGENFLEYLANWLSYATLEGSSFIFKMCTFDGRKSLILGVCGK